MKSAAKLWIIVLVVFSIIAGNTAFSQTTDTEDRTLSPYFFIRSGDPEVDQLPLKSTSASVRIAGVIADVLVTQVYKKRRTKIAGSDLCLPRLDEGCGLRNEDDDRRTCDRGKDQKEG